MLDRVISSDSHVMEPFDLWTRALGPRFGDRVPRLVKRYDGLDGDFFFCGRETARVDELMVAGASDALMAKLIAAGADPGVRGAMLDEEGIAAEVLNATWTLYMMRIEDGELRRACCRVFNDWLGDFCRASPKRFLGVAMVPIDDVEWGVRELERVRKLGLRGVMVPTNPIAGARPYRDPSYDRFWAAAVAHRLPVTLHIVTGAVRDPFTYLSKDERPEFPRSYVEIFNEAAPVLASEFIFGGVLDRFPALTLFLSEYDAFWIPNFKFRVARMARFGLLPAPKRSADEYVRDNIFLGILADPLAMRLRDEIGVDQLMWGSDFPHPGGQYPDTKGRLAAYLGDAPAAVQRKIAADNVVKLYDIEL